MLMGLDIGGTKCAVVLGKTRSGSCQKDHIEILDRSSFATPATPDKALAQLLDAAAQLAAAYAHDEPLDAVGISCGGPLDSRRGLILSPPNLPRWDRVDVLTPINQRFGVPAALENDANACALAEWHWGAGRGCRNMVFLTFGTGMGAGLILDGRLYRGTNDMAGEVGHIRLAPDGPIGYGKAGSFEGFCSGGGIANAAQSAAKGWLAAGHSSVLGAPADAVNCITAKDVAEAAQAGDALALEILRSTALYLGRGLATLIDILNPERIVLGSIYVRQRALLQPLMMEELAREALALSQSVCEIVPAGLGEAVGDYASLSVAADAVARKKAAAAASLPSNGD